jgi:outer membrane receptor protein involved in Fe transport
VAIGEPLHGAQERIPRRHLICNRARRSLGNPGFAQTAPAEASADNPADPSAEGLETIVVTGTRRSVSIQDAPINIAAVTADSLKRDHIDDVRSLAAFTPGITVQDTGPRNTGTIVLRGLSADDNSSFGDNYNNTLATYMGEIPLYQDFKFLDMDRIEVLLGPQGTLYGLGTLAGAIRYIPNRPDPDNWSGTAHGRVYGVSHSSAGLSDRRHDQHSDRSRQDRLPFDHGILQRSRLHGLRLSGEHAGRFRRSRSSPARSSARSARPTRSRLTSTPTRTPTSSTRSPRATSLAFSRLTGSRST